MEEILQLFIIFKIYFLFNFFYINFKFIDTKYYFIIYCKNNKIIFHYKSIIITTKYFEKVGK